MLIAGTAGSTPRKRAHFGETATGRKTATRRKTATSEKTPAHRKKTGFVQERDVHAGYPVFFCAVFSRSAFSGAAFSCPAFPLVALFLVMLPAVPAINMPDIIGTRSAF